MSLRGGRGLARASALCGALGGTVAALGGCFVRGYASSSVAVSASYQTSTARSARIGDPPSEPSPPTGAPTASPRAVAVASARADGGPVLAVPAVSPGAVDPATGLPAEVQLPAQGCEPSTPSVRGFRTDDAALRALEDAAPEPAPPPLRALRDGPVAMDLPAAWFAARVDVAAANAYRVRTGDDAELVTLYLGAEPPVRLRGPGATPFRLALGGVSVRGAVLREGVFLRLEALALLPCSAPRFVHFSARSGDPAQLARAARALRTLRVERSAAAWSPRGLEPSLLDPQRDGPAVRALAGDDAATEALLRRALEGAGLRARYPLDEAHPLADQLLVGSYEDTLAGQRVRLWVRAPVRAGRVQLPASLRAAQADRAGLERALAAASAPATGPDRCEAPAWVLASDGVALRCGDEPEHRASCAEDDPAGLVRALGAARRARATLRALGAARGGLAPALRPLAPLCARGDVQVHAVGDAAPSPARGPGAPAARGPARGAPLGVDAPALYASREGCALVLDPTQARVRALAVEGDCEALATLAAPWASGVRAALRLDELRAPAGSGNGAARGACRFSLGATAHGGWVVAAGDGGSATAPLASGPVVAVDRRAVHTALGALHDLLDYAAERTAQAPPNVHPSVLRALDLERPGGPGGARVLARVAQRGGLEGPGVSAVLAARAVDAEHVEVTLLPYTLVLAREGGGWVVTELRPTLAPSE